MIDTKNMTPAERVKLAEDMLAVALAELVQAWVAIDREARSD